MCLSNQELETRGGSGPHTAFVHRGCQNQQKMIDLVAALNIGAKEWSISHDTSKAKLLSDFPCLVNTYVIQTLIQAWTGLFSLSRKLPPEPQRTLFVYFQRLSGTPHKSLWNGIESHISYFLTYPDHSNSNFVPVAWGWKGNAVDPVARYHPPAPLTVGCNFLFDIFNDIFH